MPKRPKEPMQHKSVRMSLEEMDFLARNGQHHSTQLHHDIAFLKNLLELDRAAGKRITLSEGLELAGKITASPADAITLLVGLLENRDPPK